MLILFRWLVGAMYAWTTYLWLELSKQFSTRLIDHIPPPVASCRCSWPAVCCSQLQSGKRQYAHVNEPVKVTRQGTSDDFARIRGILLEHGQKIVRVLGEEVPRVFSTCNSGDGQ